MTFDENAKLADRMEIRRDGSEGTPWRVVCYEPGEGYDSTWMVRDRGEFFTRESAQAYITNLFII